MLGLSVSVTMLLAAVLAFAQSDLKRLLAWSTVSQVGVMLSALAAAPPVDGPDAGLFHLWSHAVFKALLFLAIGWAGIVAGGTAATALRGSAVAAPLLRVSFLFGLLSLAGVPLVVGGLSKEHVIAVSWEGAVESGPGVVVLVALLVTAAVTAAYCTRAYLLLTAHVRPAATTGAGPGAGAGRALGARRAQCRRRARAAHRRVRRRRHLARVGRHHDARRRRRCRRGPARRARPRPGRGPRPPPRAARRPGPRRRHGLPSGSWPRRCSRSPGVVAFLDTEVVDAYVRATAVATRVAGWAGARAHRGERPASAVGLVLAAVVVLGLAGVLAWS